LKINSGYYYKGSTNCYLHMEQVNGDEIQLSTDYGEKIKDVYTTIDLIKAINDLENGKYA
jgi:hypothetical protein